MPVDYSCSIMSSALASYLPCRPWLRGVTFDLRIDEDAVNLYVYGIWTVLRGPCGLSLRICKIGI